MFCAREDVRLGTGDRGAKPLARVIPQPRISHQTLYRVHGAALACPL